MGNIKKSFTNKYNKINTKILNCNSPLRPRNFSEFINMFILDNWNHQLFSLMIDFLSKNENKNHFIIQKKKLK